MAAIRGLKLETHAIVSIDCATNAVPAVLLIGAIVCYAIRGGNFIVRGLLEDRAFAEYFLVGSLCSALVALLAGMLVSMVAAAVPRDSWITLLA